MRYLFIDGRQVPPTSRHTELNDAFKNSKQGVPWSERVRFQRKSTHTKAYSMSR
jgi:hypothetical protein